MGKLRRAVFALKILEKLGVRQAYCVLLDFTPALVS